MDSTLPINLKSVIVESTCIRKKEYRKHRVAKNPKLQYTEVDNGRDKKCVTESPTNMSIRERFGVGVMKEGKGEGEMDLKKKTINGVLWEYFPEVDLFNYQCPNIKKNMSAYLKLILKEEKI